MKRKPQPNRKWTYGRAFFLTLGMALIGLIAVIWGSQGERSGDWPAFAWCLFAALISAGLALCCFALLSHDTTIKKAAGSAGKHEGEILIAILAGPVYWIGKLFEKPCRRK